LDDLCSQGIVPLASYDLKRSHDKNLIRQPASLSCSAGVSLQNSSKNLQLNQKLYDDVDSICEIPNYDLEFVEYYEHQELCHFYHDPIAIYMEDFFTLEFQSISTTSFFFYGSKALCCEDQTDNQFLVPLQDLVMSFVKNSQREELFDQLLDWFHWHFSIT
jgi:hypothetical protein